MTTPAGTEHLRVRRWSIATIAIFAILGVNLGTWLSRLPSVRDQLGASTFEMSVYGLALALGSVIGLLFSGRAVTWLGARRTLYIGFAVQTVALSSAVALLWVGQLGLGMALLFVYGFAFSISDVAINISGAEAERALGRPRMPAFHGAYSLGAVATMGIGAAAEALRVPAPIHVAVVVALGVVLAFSALRWIPHDRPAAAPAVRDDDSVSIITGPLPVPGVETVRAAVPGYNPWRDPRIYLVGLIGLSMSLAEGTGSDWISLALVDGHGFPNSLATLTVGVFFTAMVLTRFAGTALLERFGRVAVIRGSALIATAGVIVVILAPVPWAAVVGTGLWGVGCALGFPVAISAAADDPTTSARSVAAVSMIGYGAFLVGPPMIGFLGEHFGLLSAFWPVPVAAALCVAVAGALRPRGSVSS